MLLSKDDYSKLFFENNTPKSTGTLLNYVLDDSPEKQNLIESIADKLNLKTFRINGKPESG